MFSRFAVATERAIPRGLPLVSAMSVVLVLLAVAVEVETGLFSEYERRNIVCNRAIGAIRTGIPSPQAVQFRDCTISAMLVGIPEPKGSAILRRVVTINAYDEASGQLIDKHTVTFDERALDVR